MSKYGISAMMRPTFEMLPLRKIVGTREPTQIKFFDWDT
jgi:hypothetical protein